MLQSHLAQIPDEIMQVEATQEQPLSTDTASSTKAGEGTSTEDSAANTSSSLSEEEQAKLKEKEKEEAAFLKRMLSVPEAEIFIQLLVTIFLLDQKASDASIACAASLIQRAQTFNRRYS